MEQQTVERVILHDLYEAWFLHGRLFSLEEICGREHWDAEKFWKIVDHLDEKKHARAVAAGGCYEITPVGIVFAENNGIADEDLVAKNQRARTLMLDTLFQIREEQVNWVGTHYSTLCEKTGLDETIAVYNLQVLEELGYVDEKSGFGERLTMLGIESIKNYRQRRAIAEDFERISDLGPQPRGRALQVLFAKIVERQGWSQEEGVRTSNEEIDVIVFKGREYYLVECKWEKDPIEAGVIREFYGKLSKRAGIGGLVVSMSGFTAGAIEEVLEHATSHRILLFGPEDIHSIVYSKQTFDEMLNAKSAELTIRKKVLQA
jgi:hypothetical protein